MPWYLILAIAFGIAQMVGTEYYLEQEVHTLLKDHPAIAEKIMAFAQAALSRTKGDLLTSLGFIFLFWSAGTLQLNIERTMDEGWHAEKGRRWYRKITDYLAVVIFCPIWLAGAGGLSLALDQILLFLTAKMGLPPHNILYSFSITFLAFLFSWVFFSLLYLLMPSCKVPCQSAIQAGVFAGTLFQLLQWGYLHLQQLLTSYSIIYGSFAAHPLKKASPTRSWCFCS